MNATADADTFIVVYPQADIAAGSGFDGTCPDPLFGGATVPAGSPDDVAFIRQLVSSLEQHTASTGTGSSPPASPVGPAWPASWAVTPRRLRRHRPGQRLRLPKPCPVHPGRSGGGLPRHRRPGRPLPRHGQSTGPTAFRGRRRWARHNLCPKPVNSRPAPRWCSRPDTTVCRRIEVELYPSWARATSGPVGRTCPGASRRCSGRQSSAISANDVMWSFFVAHPLP